jgi:hypothetical protein
MDYMEWNALALAISLLFTHGTQTDNIFVPELCGPAEIKSASPCVDCFKLTVKIMAIKSSSIALVEKLYVEEVQRLRIDFVYILS